VWGHPGTYIGLWMQSKTGTNYQPWLALSFILTYKEKLQNPLTWKFAAIVTLEISFLYILNWICTAGEWPEKWTVKINDKIGPAKYAHFFTWIYLHSIYHLPFRDKNFDNYCFCNFVRVQLSGSPVIKVLCGSLLGQKLNQTLGSFMKI